MVNKVFRAIFGLRNSSTPGSNQRRLMSRMTLFVAMVFLGDIALDYFAPNFYAILFALVWSISFFLMIVIWVVYLASEDYPPDPVRLIFDVLISAFFAIVSFSLAYEAAGIIDTLEPAYIASAVDNLYFSAVTFSTLGFGDFRPASEARLLASLEALLGNLHLGLLAGAAFYAVQFKPQKSGKEHASNKSNEANDP